MYFCLKTKRNPCYIIMKHSLKNNQTYNFSVLPQTLYQLTFPCLNIPVSVSMQSDDKEIDWQL